MRITLKLQGAGEPGDPYRVGLPTYSDLRANVPEGYASVEVPEPDAPRPGEDDVDWHARLVERYGITRMVGLRTQLVATEDLVPEEVLEHSGRRFGIF